MTRAALHTAAERTAVIIQAVAGTVLGAAAAATAAGAAGGPRRGGGRSGGRRGARGTAAGWARDRRDGGAGVSEAFTALEPDARGIFSCWCVSGCLVVLTLRPEGRSAVRWAGSGAAMPGDGRERMVAEVVAWPRVGEKMRLVFADGGRLTTTEAMRIERFEPPASAVTRKKQKGEESGS